MSDVAVKPKASEPLKFAGIVCSTLPVRDMAKYNETKDDNQAMTPSGLFNKLGNRFDDVTYYG